jgi:putative sterol carrier protein
MAHYETDAEVYEQLGGILTNLVYNTARREQLHQADAVVQFAFRDPVATVTLDMRANKRARVDLGDTKLRADVVLAMDADTGRAILHGELSPTLALARGEVRTKGPVGKVLRVVPATVGAHEVEADIEPDPEPEVVAEAPAAPAADAVEAPDAPAAEAASETAEAPAVEPVEEAAPAAEEAAPAVEEAAPAAEAAPVVEEAAPAEAAASAEEAAPAAEAPDAPATEAATEAADAPAADPAPEDETPA